jgi:hypothetical protein
MRVAVVSHSGPESNSGRVCVISTPDPTGVPGRCSEDAIVSPIPANTKTRGWPNVATSQRVVKDAMQDRAARVSQVKPAPKNHDTT